MAPVIPDAPPPQRIEGEFWTSKQRQASSLHEISYRACFKPQLPRYFIERFSKEGDVVYDPFMGRGTTVIEAALLRRNVIGNDVNPLSKILAAPRLDIPAIEDVERRLAEISFSKKVKADIDLSMFFHRDTEAEIVSLQKYLARRERGKWKTGLTAGSGWLRPTGSQVIHRDFSLSTRSHPIRLCSLRINEESTS
jgi:hypothetical protein